MQGFAAKKANAGFVLLGVYASLIPFQLPWLPITLFMLLYCLYWLLSNNWQARIRNWKDNRWALLMPVFFAYHLIALSYSPVSENGLKDVVLKIPMIVWPLVLVGTAGIQELKRQTILKIFKWAAVLSLSYCLITSLISYLAYPSHHVFYMEELVDYKFIPPHYLGLYLNFAYGLSWQQFIGKQTKPAFHWILVLFIGTGLVLISVRSQILIFSLLTIFFAFSWLKRRMATGPAVLLSAGLCGLFLVLGLSLPGSRKRIEDTVNELKSFEKVINNKQTNPRKYLWTASLSVIRERPWLGTGPGAENLALNRQLAKQPVQFWDGTKTYFLHEQGFNYHNAYLQHWASLGLPGLLFLVALLLYPFLAWRRCSAEFRLLSIICLLSFSTESMLQRQAGVLFFSFFYALLFAMPTPSRGRNFVN